MGNMNAKPAMKQIITTLLVTLFCVPLVWAGAKFDPLQKPNTFKNKDNPYYWKNRAPRPGYWQQDIYYSIKATLSDKTDIISGEEKLTYWNNSPDDIDFVYFHLYQNAFQPGSYYDNLQRNNGKDPKYGKYESQKLGTVVEYVKVDGEELGMELDNTILRVQLNNPLMSGGSITFDIKFKTYFDGTGEVRRRMKVYKTFGHKHYNGVHWYPRISVYDAKFGWTTDQHLGREFYGDFGAFDVELTLPHHYILDGTGFMTNRDEMLPEDLMAKLDIKNFKDKPLNSIPSVIIPEDSAKTKTWKFHAENVHDFAWTADPLYRIGQAEWNGITCYSLAQEQHASGWQNAASYAAKIIKVFSQDFGWYAYHKMIVADARDGMEYPMLTLDNGTDPGYRGLLVHEIAHNWFYGMVGNNETYRASLDEGFTQFLTVWGLDNIDGPYAVTKRVKSNYYNKYYLQPSNRDNKLYNSYLKDAIKENDPALNTHSDAFNGALQHGGGYRQVYSKTGTMLFNLEYVLGRGLFLEAMQYYFGQWKFCHPYFEDFRLSITEYTKVDLNWFFDQWLETNKNIDYAVTKVKSIGYEPAPENPATPEDTLGKHKYEITFERKGRMHMPLDFEIFTKDEYACVRYMYHIPNTHFVKDDDVEVMPKWHGWDKLNPTYTTQVTLPAEIADVVIDPSYRLADINMLNNSKKLPIFITFDSRITNPLDWTAYRMFIRPNLWYNVYDGVRFGASFNGNYMKYKHLFNGKLWFSPGIVQDVWYNAKIDADSIKIGEDNFNEFVSFQFGYQNSIDKISKNSKIYFNITSREGLRTASIKIDKRDRANMNKIYFTVKSMIRPDSTSLNYLLYPDHWSVGQFNNILSMGYQHKYDYSFGNAKINIDLNSSTLFSDFDYHTLTMSHISTSKLGKLDFRMRTFGQYFTGTNMPNESALYFAGANPETMFENSFYSAAGIFPKNWGGFGANTNVLHYGGGLNMRGYSGYLVAQEDANGVVQRVYKGGTGAAINVELEFNRLFYNDEIHWEKGSWNKKKKKPISINTYLFGDVGLINYNAPGEKLAFSDIRMDAGLGAALTVNKLGVIEEIKPFTVRFDVPLLLTRTPAVDADFVQFRWILGISRAF
ncbi:MAG: aminopeptidase [Bacteroidetes bacterium]|nr:MAG: aminopeptidase [Bacteroidota bacterium]